MKEFAAQLYNSIAWKKTRAAYAKSKQNLCEICLSKGIIKPGVIVHHKIHLDPQNVNDPNIALNWENLQLVCRDCHAYIHDRSQRRYKFDDYGRAITRD